MQLDNSIVVFICIICSLAALSLAFDHADALKKKEPNLKPYTWGYFVGWSGVLTGGALALVFAYGVTQSRRDVAAAYMFFSLWAALAAIFSYLIVRRSKLGWIVGTLLSLNILFWIINAVYVTRRWSELKGLHWPKYLSWSNPAQRAIIVATGFWTFLVTSFVIVFNPYGYYTDWNHVFKIIAFPPAMLIIGYILYAKLLRSKNI